MDTFDLPVTTARAILDTAEQEARDPIRAPNPVSPGPVDQSRYALCSHPSQNILGGAGGACASRPDTLIVLPLCLCVRLL